MQAFERLLQRFLSDWLQVLSHKLGSRASPDVHIPARAEEVGVHSRDLEIALLCQNRVARTFFAVSGEGELLFFRFGRVFLGINVLVRDISTSSSLLTTTVRLNTAFFISTRIWSPACRSSGCLPSSKLVLIWGLCHPWRC